MAVTVFNQDNACRLLARKSVLMFGDSNMRAIYKDLVWLLEEGTLIPKSILRKRNEQTHANDRRTSDGELTASRNYKEVREYDLNTFVHFEFITRLCPEKFLTTMRNTKIPPDVVIVNSCMWDLSRWGPSGVTDYLKNFEYMVQFVEKNFKDQIQFVWLTTLPPSFKCHGGFLTEDIRFLNKILPVNIIEANKFAVDCLRKHGFEVIDLHYCMRLLIDMRCSDGIHWEPKPTRYIVNLILNHLSRCWKVDLPVTISDREFYENHKAHRLRDRNVCGKIKRISTRNGNVPYDFGFVGTRSRKVVVRDKISVNGCDFKRYVNTDDGQCHNSVPYNDVDNYVRNKYRFTNVGDEMFVFGDDEYDCDNVVQEIDNDQCDYDNVAQEIDDQYDCDNMVQEIDNDQYDYDMVQENDDEYDYDNVAQEIGAKYDYMAQDIDNDQYDYDNIVQEINDEYDCDNMVQEINNDEYDFDNIAQEMDDDDEYDFARDVYLNDQQSQNFLQDYNNIVQTIDYCLNNSSSMVINMFKNK